MQSKTFLMTVGLAVIASSALAQGDGARAPSRCSVAGHQHGVGSYLYRQGESSVSSGRRCTVALLL
jgi:hypothetical protein